MFPLTTWDIDLVQLSSLLEKNPSLRGFLFGYVAQQKLMDDLRQNSRISSVAKADDHDRKKKGHIIVNYENTEIRLEARSLQVKSIKQTGSTFTGDVQCDASDRREVKVGKESVSTTCLMASDFDILAACVFPFKGEWKFIYCLSNMLPRSTHKKYPPQVQNMLIKGTVRVSWPPEGDFSSDPIPLLDRIVAQRKSRSRP